MADRKRPAREKASIVVVFSFVLVLLLLGGLKFIWPEQAKSARENRTLAQRPAVTLQGLKDGSWPLDFEEYYTDQFPFRNNLIGLSNRMRNTIRIRFGDDIRIVQGSSDMGQGNPNEAFEDLPQREDELLAPGYTSPFSPP